MSRVTLRLCELCGKEFETDSRGRGRYCSNSCSKSKGPNEHWEDAAGIIHLQLNHGIEALVDKEDYPKISKYHWYATKQWNTYYAFTTSHPTGEKRAPQRMHQILFEAADGLERDHWNGIGVDNRRTNIRIVTHRVNGQNLHRNKVSKYPGVSWSNASRKWQTHIQVAGKLYGLGVFDTEEAAYSAYMKACSEVEAGTFVPRTFNRTSEYRGVSWAKKAQKWLAQTTFHGEHCFLGYFDIEQEAFAAYQRARAEIEYGTFVPRRRK